MRDGGTRRVWHRTQALPDGDAYRIMLDERPLRLPGGAVLRLRQRALADAVAAEWSEAGGGVPGGTFGPESLGLTRLAATLQERVAPDRAGAIRMLLADIDGDLLCYRATHPASLVLLQQERWQPWLEWARETYAANFIIGAGVMPIAQPEAVRVALGRVLAAQDDAALTGLGVLVPLLGSLVLGLAVADGALAAETAAELALLDTSHQAERWGADAEITARRARTAEEAAEVWRFIALTRAAAVQRWLIEGRVQGVGYRMWLQAEARALDVRGWVRNLADGRVEAVVQGTHERLAQLLHAAERGPMHATVARILVQDTSAAVPPGPFAQLADA